MIRAMSEKSERSVIGALPHSRPHRRSAKRAARPPEPPPTQSDPAGQQPPARPHDPLATAVQAAAELAEIGLTVGARALRSAVSRLPRP
jgi:hypothetical protein